MFCPILQISGSSYSKTRFFSIPCRIKHHIQSVFGHSHTGIFAAPRPILIFKIIFGRKKNRASHPLHLNPILTFSITNTWSSFTYALSRIIFCAVKYNNFSVFCSSSRIKSITFFPLHLLFPHRTIKFCRLRWYDRINSFRTMERTNHPIIILFFLSSI